MDSRSVEPADADADPGRWRALSVCLVAGFMTLLDVTIVNVALPSIQSGLHAGHDDVSWVISGYTLTFGLTLIPAGRLGDAWGRKTMFLTGLMLFTLVSALCALSTDPTWLVVARLLQGAAAGLLNPQIVGMIQHLFRGPERGTAFGWYGGMIAISTAIGPLTGGLLIQWAGWRSVFMVNLPIGVLALVLGVLLLPKTRPQRQRRGFDLVGVLLLGGCITAMLLPLIEQQQGTGAVHWWLLALAAVLLGGFVGWQRHRRGIGRVPLIDLGLLRTHSFGFSGAIGLVYFAGYAGLLFILSLYLQQGRGFSALAAGATGTPFAVGSAISATVSGRLVYRMGRAMVMVGLTAVMLGLAATATVIQLETHGAVWLAILGPLLVTGLGSGLVIGPNQTLALRQVPPAEGGTAAAVIQTGQRIGRSLGVAVAATLFFGYLTSTPGGFPAAASRSLYGGAALVAVALLIGVIELLAARRSGTERLPYDRRRVRQPS